MAETTKQHPLPDEHYRPWRLLTLIGWLLFFLVFLKLIPGVELTFIQGVIAAAGLMMLSWFTMPKKRGKILGYSSLFAVAAIGWAFDLSIGQKMALIGMVALFALGGLLWLLRRSSLRLRLTVIGLALGLAGLEFIAGGLDAIMEALAP